MANTKLRVNIRSAGTRRNLLVIEEAAAGDIYIRIKSGTQVGIPPNHIEVVQDRISIHPSPKSEFYTTIKHTLELANGFRQSSVALTDAVKRRNGFTHILTHRASDLVAPVYDCKDDQTEAIELGDFDPAKFSLVVGIFVGGLESVFDIKSQSEALYRIQRGRFQIILCYTWINLAALPFSWTMKTLTFAPEIFDDEHGQESAYRKMAGESVPACLELFRGLTNELIVNLLETYWTLTDDSAVKENIRQSIASVPRIASIRM